VCITDYIIEFKMHKIGIQHTLRRLLHLKYILCFRMLCAAEAIMFLLCPVVCPVPT